MEMDISFQYKLKIGTCLQLIIDKLGKSFKLELCNYLIKGLSEQECSEQMSIAKCEQLSQVARIIVINSRDDPSMSENISNILAFFVTITDKYLDSMMATLI
jgi:hypothetical protein